MVLFYIILNYFTKINANKKAEHNESVSKDESVSITKSTAWYDYNCDKQQGYLNAITFYDNDKNKFKMAKKTQEHPKDLTFSEYKKYTKFKRYQN